MRKFLPLLLLATLLLSGCLINNKEKLAVEKAIMKLDSPMSEEDTKMFPSDLEEETKARGTYGYELNVGKWVREVKEITIYGSDATAFVKWKLPITATVTFDSNIKTYDLSLYGEGNYTLKKVDNDEWQVTGYPLFNWMNAYGPTVSDITVYGGSKARISAIIPVGENVWPVVLATSGNPFYLTPLVKEVDSNTFTATPIGLFSAEPKDKHKGVITAITVPNDTSVNFNYGITICYFETTIKE